MRLFLILVLTIVPTWLRAADHSPESKSQKPSANLPLPKHQAKRSNCAAYGPGFVNVEGTDTCVSIGGTMSVGAGTSSRPWR
jgi:hypothetical protein